MSEVGPFPFDRLPRLPALAVGPLRAVARAARAPAGWRGALEALGTVLAQPVRVEAVDVRWADPRRPPELPEALVALRLELLAGVVIAELDPTTAIAFVDAALGVGAEGDPAAFRPLRNAETGVLAYLAARFVLAAQPRGGRLLGWTTDTQALALALRAAPHVEVRLEVAMAGRRLGARLWLPASTVAALPPVEPDWSALAGARVRLRAVIGSVSLTAGDAAEIAPGDVVLLDRARARCEAGSWNGEAQLGFAGERAARYAGKLDPTGSRIEIQSVFHDEEDEPMAHKDGDVPVEVVVELGRTTLTVAVLSGLSPGEVVVLDRAPTDPVRLMAGDRVLAHGELVVVDGQVGVRVLDVARR